MANSDDTQVVNQAPAPFQPVEQAPAPRPFQPVAAQAQAPAPVRGSAQPQGEWDPFALGASLDITQGAPQPFQPLGSPTEAAAVQQAWQYASAGGGAPRAELVRGVAPPLQAAWDQAQAFRRQGELDNLQSVFASSTDPQELYGKLDKPIPGTWDPLSQSYLGAVSDPVRAAARDAFKNQIDQTTGQVTPRAVATEFWNQITGNLQDLQLTINKGVANIDQQHIQQFLDTALPGQSDAEKQAFLQELYRIPREQRATILDAYIPYTTTGIPSSDPQYIISAMDRLNDPALQAAQRAQLAQNEAEVRQRLADVPGLAGTPWPFIARAIGQIPRAGLAATVPPLMYADLFNQVRSGAAGEHPDWSDDQLDEYAGKSAVAQLVPQEILGGLIGRSLGPIFRDVKSGLLRATATAGLHTATGAALGAAGQASANLATGQPIGQGVAQAAGTGAIMGGVPGVAHAVPELIRPELAPEAAPEAAPPPRAPPRPEPTTGPSGARIRGPEEATLEQGQAQAEAATQVPPPVPAVQESVPTEQALPVEAQVQPQPELQPAVQAPVSVTREDVARRAYEVSEERQRLGQMGDMLGDWTRAQQEFARGPEPGPAEQAVTQGETEPWTSAIANRFTQERTAAGALGEVAPGEGASTEALLSRGLKMGPEEINQHVSDLMQGRGDPVAQASAVRAEEARLSQRSNAASRALATDPSNPQLKIAQDNAFKDLTDFHNGPVATLKNNWHAQGMGLQGEMPVDLSSFNGLREAFLRDNGKPPPAEMEPVLLTTAKRVSDAALANNGAMRKLGAEIQKQTARRRLPSADEVRLKIMEATQDMPCPR